MKKKTILISVILVVTFAAAGIYYLHFRSSPQYSLLQLGNAVMQHDYNGFEKYVDVDGTLSGLIDQMLEKNDGGTVSASDFLNNVGWMDFIKPQLGQMFKPLIRQWVEKGTFNAVDPLTGQGSLSLPDLWSRSAAYRITGVTSTRRDGDVALVGLGIQPVGADTVLVVNVKMINKGDHWQISGLPGFSDFRKAVTNIEQKRVDEANKPIQEEMRRTLQLAYLQKGEAKDKKGLRMNIMFGIKNTGTKAIVGYDAVVSVSSEKHWPIDLIHINKLPNHFEPGNIDSVIWAPGHADLVDSWLFENNLKSTLSVKSIQFSDSTTLRLKNMWQWD